jgi:hypothetical protein
MECGVPAKANGRQVYCCAVVLRRNRWARPVGTLSLMFYRRVVWHFMGMLWADIGLKTGSGGTC